MLPSGIPFVVRAVLCLLSYAEVVPQVRRPSALTPCQAYPRRQFLPPFALPLAHPTMGAPYRASLYRSCAPWDRFPWALTPFPAGRGRIPAGVCTVTGREPHQERRAEL